MKILVLSDSHRTIRNMIDAVELFQPDHIIHLGDHTSDADELSRHYPMLPVLSVRGNCDYDLASREQALAVFGKTRILAVHGHRYGVKSGLLRYVLAAKENHADVALFGHTHQAHCEKYESIWLLNPGSCGYTSRPSCGIIELAGDTVSCRIAYLDERG